MVHLLEERNDRRPFTGMTHILTRMVAPATKEVETALSAITIEPPVRNKLSEILTDTPVSDEVRCPRSCRHLLHGPQESLHFRPVAIIRDQSLRFADRGSKIPQIRAYVERLAIRRRVSGYAVPVCSDVGHLGNLQCVKHLVAGRANGLKASPPCPVGCVQIPLGGVLLSLSVH